MFVIFSIGVAAAEAAVGLALIIAIYRHYRTDRTWIEMNSHERDEPASGLGLVMQQSSG